MSGDGYRARAFAYSLECFFDAFAFRDLGRFCQLLFSKRQSSQFERSYSRIASRSNPALDCQEADPLLT
jgi:hypothetical protein